MAVTSRPLTDIKQSSGHSVHMLSQAITIMLAFCALVALVLAVQTGVGWVERRLDDLRYGFPRVAQVSGVVGFGDSLQTPSQALAINSDGQITIIVLPAGDSARLNVLAGPYLVGYDGPYEVAQPYLVDANQDDRLDLLVRIRGEDLVYLNRGDSWSIITSEERKQLLEK